MSNKQSLLVLVFIYFSMGCYGIHANSTSKEKPSPSYQVSLGEPSKEWITGLPIANGITAAMVWGEPSKIVLSLNHIDFWRDDWGKTLNDYSLVIRQAQQLMLQGKINEANELYYSNIKNNLNAPNRRKSCPGIFSGYTNSFQPIGNINIELDRQAEYTKYRRTLDLNNGIGNITYQVGDNKVTQQYFIPANEDVIVVRIISYKPISGRITFDRPDQAEYHWAATVNNNQLAVQGAFDEGVKSSLLTEVKNNGNKNSVTANVEKTILELNNLTKIDI